MLDVATIIAMYESGMSARAIAIKLGVSHKTIRRRLPAIDKSRKYIKPTQQIQWQSKQERDKLICDLSSKYNAPTIARMLNMYKKSVYRIQDYYGVRQGHRPIYNDLSDDAIDKIVSLYGTMPTSEIAHQFGIGNDRVVRFAAKRGKTLSSQAGLRLHNYDIVCLF